MHDFRLQRTDGEPFDPPTYRCSALSRRQGDTIPLGHNRKLRVSDTRLADGTDSEPVTVLVMEPT